MFFSLSGFLVVGSIFRCKALVSFFSLRILRILLALFVEVTLSALVLGPIFTTHKLSSYFADPVFRSYFLNIAGDIHYALPGVFEHVPFANFVNAQLWTIPWELRCYIALGLMAFLTLIKHRISQVVFLIVMQIALAFYVVYKIHAGISSHHGQSGLVLLISYFAGLCIYLYKDILPWNKKLFIAALFLSCLVELFP